MGVVRPCPREHCGGSLMMVTDEWPCKDCKGGASVCLNCWVDVSWDCTLCGRTFDRQVLLRRALLTGHTIRARVST